MLSTHSLQAIFSVEASSESQQAPSSGGATQGRPWRSSDAAALDALPLALRRLQRQRACLLSDALAGALAHLPPAFAHAHVLCAASSELPGGAATAQDGSSSEAAFDEAHLCIGTAAGSAAAPDMVADVTAFAAAVAALPGEWGAAGADPGIRETVCVFVLRLLAAATAGRALEPDLARSGLPALHARAAAELAALQRGRGGGPRLVAALAAGLLDAPAPGACCCCTKLSNTHWILIHVLCLCHNAVHIPGWNGVRVSRGSSCLHMNASASVLGLIHTRW